jgi:hypothetical protein
VVQVVVVMEHEVQQRLLPQDLPTQVVAVVVVQYWLVQQVVQV